MLLECLIECALFCVPQNLEFHGVMRFYFQDSGQKVATKCIRVASDATAQDVVETLIEKFRPDMRMLSLPEYALFEIHENGGEPSGKTRALEVRWRSRRPDLHRSQMRFFVFFPSELLHRTMLRMRICCVECQCTLHIRANLIIIIVTGFIQATAK